MITRVSNCLRFKPNALRRILSSSMHHPVEYSSSLSCCTLHHTDELSKVSPPSAAASAGCSSGDIVFSDSSSLFATSDEPARAATLNVMRGSKAELFLPPARFNIRGLSSSSTSQQQQRAQQKATSHRNKNQRRNQQRNNKKVTSYIKRLDALLRAVYKEFGHDLVQGKRVTFDEVFQEMSTYTTRAQVLAAIDTSVLLRWVPRGQTSPEHEEEEKEMDELTTTRSKSGAASSSCSRRRRQKTIPLRVNQTRIYHHFLPEPQLFQRAELRPDIFSTSTAAVMRHRRHELELLATTHDLMLLGPPSQVACRFALKTFACGYSQRFSRAFVSEGLAEALGFFAVQQLDRGEVGTTMMALRLARGKQQQQEDEEDENQNNNNSVRIIDQATQREVEKFKRDRARGIHRPFPASANVRQQENPVDPYLKKYRGDSSAGVWEGEFESFIARVQRRLPGFVLLNYFINVVGDKQRILRKPMDFLMEDRKNQDRARIFSKVISGAINFWMLPLPVSMNVVQHYFAVPYEALDMPALVSQEVTFAESKFLLAQQQERKKQQKLVGKKDNNNNNNHHNDSLVLYPPPRFHISYISADVIQQEVLPLLHHHHHHQQQQQQRHQCVALNLSQTCANFAKLLHHRWRGGDCYALVLSKQSRMGFSDFRLTDVTSRSDDDYAAVERDFKERRAAGEEEENGVGDHHTSADGVVKMPRIISRNEKRQQQTNKEDDYGARSNVLSSSSSSSSSSSPLIAYVGDDRLLHHLMRCVSRAALQSKGRRWFSSNNTSSSDHLVPRRDAVFNVEVDEGDEVEIEDEAGNFVRVPNFSANDNDSEDDDSNDGAADDVNGGGGGAKKLTYISSLEKMCQVSGWSSEFGDGGAAVALLRRFLIGHARDQAVISIAQAKYSVLYNEAGGGGDAKYPDVDRIRDDDYDDEEEGSYNTMTGNHKKKKQFGAFFAFPVVVHRSNNNNSGASGSSGGGDDDASSPSSSDHHQTKPKQSETMWVAVVPKELRCLAPFRNALVRNSTPERRYIVDVGEGLHVLLCVDES